MMMNHTTITVTDFFTLFITAERSGSQKDKLCYNLRADWVSKWLDDIGLPQYKDQFFEARVDSRMLNFITVVCVHHRAKILFEIEAVFVSSVGQYT